MNGWRVAAILLLAGLRVWAQPCEAPAEVQAAIRSGAAARDIRAQFPSDYFAHRFYQEQFFQQGLFSKEVQREYKSLLEKHADDPLYLLLYARVLKGTDTRQALAMLDRVLERDAQNGQAHLKMVEIYSAPNFKDLTKVQEHAEAYWKSCPVSLGAYTYVGSNQEFNAAAAARLRPILEKRDDDEALQLFGKLWNMEFRAVELSEQDPVRARIRKDAERLRAMDMKDRPWLISVLRQAYQETSDEEGLKWTGDRLPKPALRAGDVIMEWQIANRKPGEDYSLVNERFAKQSEEWVRQFPEDLFAWRERFRAVETLDSVPLEDAIRAAQRLLQVYELHPDGYPPYVNIASFFARHRVHFDEIPALLEKGLKPPAPAGPVSDLAPPPTNSPAGPALYDWESAARIYMQLKQYVRARELLDHIGPELEKIRPPAPASAETRRNFATRESLHYAAMQRLAWMDGRKEDGLKYGRLQALATAVQNPNNLELYRGILKQQWVAVKGSAAGFDEWFGAPAPADAATPRASVAATPGAWTALSRTLPEFKIQDAQGKRWQLADLKGKVTLINLWATWCGPCRDELPYLEKLASRVRDRKDLAVLTLNTDDDLGLVLPFLKDNHYTFPVLPAAEYVRGLVKELSIPRNWIVDAEGVLRQERVGFGKGDDQWIDEMIAAMEKVR